MRVARRRLLQWAGVTGAASMLPACKHAGDDSAAAPSGMTFFTDDERATLAGLSDVILPPTATSPGGAELGAPAFIERLCTAFDAEVPTIYAGGPFSGRQPWSSPAGERSGMIPGNDFATFLPLDRAMERAWRLQLYGSAGVPGGGPNDALAGPIIGIRDQLKTGLAGAANNPLGFADAFAGLDPDFKDLLIELVHQAAFSAPEYGGNTNLAGWKLARFEGDMAPLGFSLYDRTGATYKELPGFPVSGAASANDPAPMDEGTLTLTRAVVSFLGGRETK